MSDPKAKDLPGACASVLSSPVLSGVLLAQVQALNRDYLELLLAEHAVAGCAKQLQSLPAQLGQALAATTQSAREALASASFTLYSLGFEDQEFWRAACEATAESLETRYAPANPAWLQGQFCEVALAQAWHVAGSNRLAARVMFAMPEPTAARIAATPLSHLRRIAAGYPDLLMPRWPTNPCFWPDLVRFAAGGDQQRLAIAQLLGNQLIAAELDAAAAGHRVSEARPMRSPRLRARRLRFQSRPP